MTTNPPERDVYVAHDTQLLALLRELNARRSDRDVYAQRVIRSACKGYKQQGRNVDFFRYYGASVGERDTPWDEVPVGRIYSGTDRKGYSVILVKTGDIRDVPCNLAYALPFADASARDRYEAANAAVHAAEAAIDAHEVNYTGWSRFFLVTSSAGHVHSSLHCSTCYPTTAYAPVVALSGADEAEALELVCDTLCSVCFPSVKGKPAKITKAQARKLVGA